MERHLNQMDARAFARGPVHDWAPLPLRPGYFGMPHLTARDVHDLDSRMVSLLDNALDRARKERIYGGVDDSWRDIGATNGFKRFTKLEGYRQFYRVQGVVRAPMTNIMSLLYAGRRCRSGAATANSLRQRTGWTDAACASPTDGE
ncbi:hypothetical protein PINS_up021005 [Pythium insidiosum]|nr:hypothetical protein PINS_up021005 [Pythium insidiosum]